MPSRRSTHVLRIEQLEDRTLLSYAYTEITRTGIPSFSSVGLDPSLNNEGTVAFSWVGVVPEIRGISKGNGGPLTRLAMAPIPGGVVGTVLNDAGAAAFVRMQTIPSPSQALQTGDGKTTRPIADFLSFTNLNGRPSINNDGEVAFWGGIYHVQGIYKSDGTYLLPVIETDDYFTSLATAPAVNDSGLVAFVGNFAGGQGIFLGDGASLTPVADTASFFTGFGDRPAVNAFGVVAFHATFAGGSGIFVGDGTTVTAIALTGGAFRGFSGGVAVNAVGTVAFHALLEGGGEGIFTGPDPAADRVIATGDLLFGQPAMTFGFLGRGLNDLGQVAFRATRGAGPVFIVRADPEAGGSAPNSGAEFSAVSQFGGVVAEFARIRVEGPRILANSATTSPSSLRASSSQGSEVPPRMLAEVHHTPTPCAGAETRDTLSTALTRQAHASQSLLGAEEGGFFDGAMAL